jgi:hypothetical protein
MSVSFVALWWRKQWNLCGSVVEALLLAALQRMPLSASVYLINGIDSAKSKSMIASNLFSIW